MVYDNPDGVRIGLEVHVQLNKLNTKLFCGCSTDYHDSEPNTHVCPVCLGLPGALPVINEKAVEYAMKIGLALGCDIVEQTQFHRKNYYYPDLPKGFQTTQYDFPIAGEGKVVIEGEDGEHVVRITRAHMEEDPGRLMHMGTIEKSKGTLINYNRSGMTLIEIVSEPDMRSPKEARRYLDKLRSILDYLDVFNGDLEGAMRVDANVSVFMGERVEVKNISSFKGAERALLYEIMRQKNLIRRGGEITLETRHFDEARGVTLSMRTKEEEHDYRYFPEPDLVPMRVADRVPAVAATLPELPDGKRNRFLEEYDMTDMHAKALTSDQDIAYFYEAVAQNENIDSKDAAVWVADIFKGEWNYRDLAIHGRTFDPENPYSSVRLSGANRKDPEVTSYISSDDLVYIIESVNNGEISDNSGVEVIRIILDEGGSAHKVIDDKGLRKVEDNIVATAVSEAIAENDEAVQDYLGGTEKSLNFLVGQVMKKTKGRADARQARELLIAALKD
ncbi:Asp-tRNA(Asn)/Glu-tRNA(Gln) amidotransferase subunit GatB [Methanococcoides methylutens]|uniref:Aspartyl/glutamyl-tRNA(Asn/Gln) amidotransferase subunit B n=1 Tax=Methanococcoides methylutens MM1 TaxID=1434104 RepID=A0A0E3STU0_METMT|nr:Asp-tRNA(Asn)/Glu-tRNA(Gln) amidotransferase subunit GatB [Methanococcoides methylutens]AKB86192.1 Aspartyl-tRNA(Asn) amidotransferase subunit B / Glutamyl-tRNA(Gln) amidotransferase subunit B [Methanococcoides methylutens MM1]